VAVSFYIRTDVKEECGKINFDVDKRYKGEGMEKKYYVGLDAGSASLGWAVTNEIKLENVVLRMM